MASPLRHYKLLIGKENISGQAGEREVKNPFDQKMVGIVEYATADQMAQAIHSAAQAFETTKKLPAYERARVLAKTSQLIGERKEEIAKLIALESGKPINYARVEVDRAQFTFISSAEAAKHYGDGHTIDMSIAPSGVGRVGEYRYFPLGVIGAITPFNFPLNLVAHKVGPALAAGNTIVLKPAPQTPLTSFVLAELLLESGMTPGALNVIPCENDVAETLVRSDGIKMISFTGSDKVGWHLKSISGKARIALELGGNGAVIVDEVSDLSTIIKTLTVASFNYAGQICISLQRLLIKREYFQAVLEGMVAASKEVGIGDPLKESTLVGPMISEQAARKVEAWIQEAVEQGATRHTGEYRTPNWITPTILTNVPSHTNLYIEEAFAPVVLLEPYDTIEEAIASVNNTKYGLQCGLFSSNISVIRKCFEELEIGGLIVNDTNAFRLDTMPYGGVKSSGLGREGVMFALQEMSEIRLLVTKS